jgi:trehalose 6-phosphate phosphatase
MEALTLLRQLTPQPELIEGKYAINALPHGLGGKGPAAFALMNHLGRTGLLYIGDEDTDETVFSLPNVVTMGIRVGKEAGSRAGFYLDHQGEVEQILRVLVQCMDRSFSRLS